MLILFPIDSDVGFQMRSKQSGWSSKNAQKRGVDVSAKMVISAVFRQNAGLKPLEMVF